MASPATLAPPAFAPVNKANYPIFKIADNVWNLKPWLRSDCSGYLKAVAQAAGVNFATGDANAIVGWLTNNPNWLNLGHDAAKAAALSAQGYLVVAGRTEPGHGHVALVVPGWAPQGAPMGYWGSLNGIPAANSSLTIAWISAENWNLPRNVKAVPHKPSDPAPLDLVLYFATPLASLARVKSK
jgi:hypothetical protein